MSIVEMYSGDVGLRVKCLAGMGVKNIESIHRNFFSPQLYEAANVKLKME